MFAENLLEGLLDPQARQPVAPSLALRARRLAGMPQRHAAIVGWGNGRAGGVPQNQVAVFDGWHHGYTVTHAPHQCAGQHLRLRMLGKSAAPVGVTQHHAGCETGFQTARQGRQLLLRDRLVGRQAQRDLRPVGQPAFGATEIALELLLHPGMADIVEDGAQRRYRLGRRECLDGVTQRDGDGLRRQRFGSCRREAHLAEKRVQHRRQPGFVALERDPRKAGDDAGLLYGKRLVRGVGRGAIVNQANTLRSMP